MIGNGYFRNIILGAAAIFAALSSTTASAKVKEHDVRKLDGVNYISYVETTDEVDNPGRGFYSPKYITYYEEGNKPQTCSSGLIHLRLDISNFAAAYNSNGVDIDLTQDMLNALDTTLANLENNHCSAIVRFAYDPGFGGKDTIHEPAIEMINRHQEQLGPILSKHADCIVSVELGLFGKWGELHSGAQVSQDNFNRAIDKWLEVLPDSIPISVRTPGQYASWANVERAKLNENITVKGTKEYRVGIYNDGYLGSGSDLGTYVNRQVEIEWLANQAKHTLFGGEIVGYIDNDEPKNTAAYMETEAFTTHTSYLNIAWNNTVIDAMKKESYSGSDPLYKGKTGFEYIRNHLGYRFVVRDVRLTKETTAFENFGIEADIENVGFANLVKEKQAILILKGDNDTYYIPVSRLFETNNDSNAGADVGDGQGQKELNESVENGNPWEWDSTKTITFKAICDLEDDMPLGDYKVYLRIANDTESTGTDGYPVRFANADLNLPTIQGDETNDAVVSVWNEELGANYLGDVRITDQLPESDEDGQDVQDDNAASSQDDNNSGGQEGQNNNPNNQNGPGGIGEQSGTGNQSGQGDNKDQDSQPGSSVTLGAGVKAGDTIGWKAPDGSAGDSILVTNVDYKNKTGTATVVWHKEAGKTIEIKDEYEYYGLTLKITAIADGACKDNKKATSVIIGKNVKKIGKKAFYGLKKCNTLTIKSTKLTAKNVGKNAFGNMKKNIKVKLPKKKYKAYKKWIYKKGLSKKAAIKKI